MRGHGVPTTKLLIPWGPPDTTISGRRVVGSSVARSTSSRYAGRNELRATRGLRHHRARHACFIRKGCSIHVRAFRKSRNFRAEQVREHLVEVGLVAPSRHDRYSPTSKACGPVPRRLLLSCWRPPDTSTSPSRANPGVAKCYAEPHADKG